MVPHKKRQSMDKNSSKSAQNLKKEEIITNKKNNKNKNNKTDAIPSNPGNETPPPPDVAQIAGLTRNSKLAFLQVHV